VITPSPNAAAIGKFTETPINYNTGVPQISLPIFNWEKNNLKLSLSLNYHAGGVKIQDMPSDVGLGWAFTGIARISRSVMGLPDDNKLKGYVNTPELPIDFPETFESYIPINQQGFVFTSGGVCFGDPNLQEGVSDANSTHYHLVKAIADKTLDAQQDIFNYSYNGGSGKFIISKQKQVIFLEQTNDKIEPVFNSDNAIISFILTDQKGVKYYFEDEEKQSSQSFAIDPGPNSGTLISDYTSSWLITKIRVPELNQEISFEYVTQESLYETSFNESRTDYTTEKFTHKHSVFVGVIQPGSISSSFQIIQVKSKKIKKIIFPHENSILFDYHFSRADLFNDYALTSIKVIDQNNSQIKRLKLNYDYFIVPSTQIFHNVGYYISGNDYGKRLKITSLSELNAQNTDSLITHFEYNSNFLNRRDSRNIDLWGHNLSPFKNNNTFIPNMQLKTPDVLNNSYNIFLDGADRSPDSIFSKAGVLEKIIYPTGGYTSFDYELNEAYNEYSFYEDKKTSNEVQMLQSGWNTFNNLIMPYRNSQSIVKIFAKATENAIRNNNTCLPETQDNFITNIRIESTDNTIVRNLYVPYNQLLTNFSSNIDLPSNKEYKIKFIYNYQNSCEYQFPFNLKMYIAYDIERYSKKVGGLRIKKILYNDGVTNTNVKEFIYKNLNGKSSAKMFRPPNFDYYKTTATTTLHSPLEECYFSIYLNRSSSPNQSLSFMGGAPILYSRVIEHGNNGNIERIYDTLNPLWFTKDVYPFREDVYPDIIYNSLLKQNTYDINNQLLNETEFIYERNFESIFSSRNYILGSVATLGGHVPTPNDYTVYKVRKNTFYKGWQRVINTINKEHSATNTLIKQEQKSYDLVYHFPKQVTSINSKGETNVMQINYPFDYPTYNPMVQKNNIMNPVDEIKRLTPIGGGPINLEHVKVNYADWFSNGYYLISNVMTSKKGGTLANIYEVNAYDTKANILQTTESNGIVTSYIYGYNSQYPVAKIVGNTWATANAVFNTSDLAEINNPTTDAALRTVLQKLRTNLPNTFVTTYTYSPLIGITSETDPNNKTKYYEYDSFNRLKLIKDFNGNILKTFDYKYKQTY
jgi:hypothetical protein